MSLFRTPKFQPVPTPAPTDPANTRDSARAARLASGGTQSTLLSKAMAAASGQPVATLTGVSGG